MSHVFRSLVVTCLWLATAAFGAGQPPIGDDLQVLIDRCGHARFAERERAFLLLLDLASPARLPELEIVLRDAQVRPRIRTRVARVIGLTGGRGAREVLVHVLRSDSSEYVRAAAARSLQDLGDRRAMDDLAAALRSDPADRVRVSAAAALHRVGGKRARAELEAARPDASWQIRRVIDWALEDRGSRSRRPARVVPGTATVGVRLGTRYLLYTPRSYRTKGARGVLVGVHGTNGVPEQAVEILRAEADRLGLFVVAPFFDRGTFPNFGMLGPGYGEVRADLRLLSIVEDVLDRIEVPRRDLLLFGHSQGGAFVARFAAAHPHRVRRAVASASNGFLELGSDDAFPIGTAPGPTFTDVRFDLQRYLRTPLLCIVGADDAERFVEPARAFVAGAHEIVKQRKEAGIGGGWACLFALRVQPGVGHSGAENFAGAKDFLFEGIGDGASPRATPSRK